MSNHPKKETILRNESGLISTQAPPERALLGELVLSERPTKPETDNQIEEETAPDSLEELAGLAEAAGVAVVGEVSQKRSAPDGATLFGSGKVDEIKQLIDEENIEVFIVDRDLSPAQGRNLEKKLECRVIDRTELILDIFARRAQSKQAKLQVELAQLRYQLPRLKRMWSHLERQGGNIGMRGPGETQLETDKSLARQRISLLEKQLGTIRQQKDIEQAGAQRVRFGRSGRLHQRRQKRLAQRAVAPDRRRRFGSRYALRHFGRHHAQSRVGRRAHGFDVRYRRPGAASAT